MTIKKDYVVRISLLNLYMKKTTKQKDFLTLDEVRAKGLISHAYTADKSVYEYEIEGKGWTLVKNDVKLCENVDRCYYSRSKGVYAYKIKGKGKGETLVENGVILCENVHWCFWYSKGVYKYQETRNSNVVSVGF